MGQISTISHLEPGGPGSNEAVVGMPVEGSHGRLDRLLDVLRDPPVVLL